MIKKSVLMVFILFLTSGLYTDVQITKKVEVYFPRFGTYRATVNEFLQKSLHNEKSVSSVKGEGFLGKLIAGFFPQGMQAQIINLNEKAVFSLDYDKKEYTRLSLEDLFAADEDDDMDEIEESDPEPDHNRKVLRQELKVIDKGKTGTLNSFETQGYHIIYIYETEEIETGKIHTDSLFVDVKTTVKNAEFEKADKEIAEYHREFVKSIGMDQNDENAQELLGLEWLNILRSMDQESSSTDTDFDYGKLKKIKGRPVLIDGTFFSRDLENSPEVKPKKSPLGFGGLKKSLVKSVEDKVSGSDQQKAAYKQVMNYRVETVSVSLDKLGADVFSIPDDFKEKKGYQRK
ncbi:MAG: hypothetical protein JW996_01970 [Candidatus Cloacimonetes bacterium]|nr:hypothetical protein [Candidatus Cloacimonadota bacterium]